MTEHRGQHREGKQRHAENQYGGYAVMQEPSPFALSGEPESALRRRPHRRWCQCRTLVTAISCSSFSTNNIGRQFRLPSTRIAFDADVWLAFLVTYGLTPGSVIDQRVDLVTG